MKHLYNAEQIDNERPTYFTLKEWSKESGIKLATLKSRRDRGWTKEEILYRKVRFNESNPSKFNPIIYEKVGKIADPQKAGNTIQLI